ncbi:MAG: ribosomal protein L24 [Candidatus Xenolissoclinum pacificiensis L6]|uniref:Large ribosomal subunit protein uL24 n=1 Tax=Candidatus Xenolissoclinum pacificiensis L6 TaxID=1401685 RepID=W2UZC5_9RICK|nr:MAG: ribosomal protein L24 [Candidatus Xenolissoclinum pacificiensis L6]
MKIKKGDNVIVITGKDVDKIGKVLSVLSNGYVVVEGVRKYSVKKRDPRTGAVNAILKEKPIHISNVMYWCDEDAIKSRVGYKFVDGKKIRYLKANQREL